jgi:glucose/arabinose dehydrogenase
MVRPRGALALCAPILSCLVAVREVPAQGLPATPVDDLSASVASLLIAEGFERPVFVTSPPGDLTRLLVLEQTSGMVRLIRNGTLVPAPFLDLGAKVHKGGGERGLLGLAFHPQYAANGAFFVDYNDAAGDIVVERYSVSADPNKADPLSALKLFDIPKPTQVHQAGMLAFGPDGMLYIATGDGGSSPALNVASSPASLLGKLLRVDVDAGVPYAIPPDNPFVGVPGALGEIWARGLRNPWRFSFDRLSGDLYVGDVGEGAFEELNWLPAGTPGGADFGWDCLEGEQCTGHPGCSCPAPVSVAPLAGYSHDSGCAIVGGYAYAGVLPQLAGAYLYADYCTGSIHALRHDGSAVTSVTDLTSQLDPPFAQLGQVSSLGEDAAGELYIVGYTSGKLWKIVQAPPAPDCDGDGASDAEELAAGTAFDFDSDGMPDECQLELEIGPLVGGFTTVMTFVGGQPGETVFFLYTTRGIGPGPCFFQGSLCLSLLPPVSVLGAATVSTSGGAVLLVSVPAGTPIGVPVYFQAVLYRGPESLLSNTVIHITLP